MTIGMERIAAPLAVAIALSLSTAPAFAGAARDAATEALSQRLFPLLDRLGHDKSALNSLKTRPDAARVLDARQARRAACGEEFSCTAMAMMWSDAEAATLAAAIEPLVRGAAPDDGAAAGITREVQGINAIVSSYALGAVPRYAQIDGAGMLDPQEARVRLQGALALAQTPRDGSAQALDLSIEFALALLDTHDRTDAIGFEPLVGGLNAPAFERARRIDWKRWRYTAMIVTGVGPETPDMPLSAMGKYHLRLAANRFAEGDIPFIIVTGGRAHPRATRFAEAEEMRRALIERHGVPADAILIEPYARHTTTNLRNASRLLMMLRAPLDRDTLIVSNPTQSAYIESPAFTQRNEAELGYQPGQVVSRVSPTELVFRPSARSARIDPRDPLDP